MAVFYQLAGTQLALPDYARIDLAYTYTYMISNHVVPGAYIEIPTAAVLTLTTGATIANRIVEFSCRNQDGAIIAATEASAVQAANTQISYVINVGLPFAYTTAGSYMVFGIPTLACLPAWTIELGVTAFQTGDAESNVTVSVVRIPTGPALSTAPPVLTPTPLIS